MTSVEHAALEQLITERGLFAVVDALSGICGHHAEQKIELGDVVAANEWHRAESAINAAASRILDCNL